MRNINKTNRYEFCGVHIESIRIRCDHSLLCELFIRRYCLYCLDASATHTVNSKSTS